MPDALYATYDFNKNWLIDFIGREERREKDPFVVPLSYAFITKLCFLYVPRPGIKPATLVYQDGALTN